MITRNKVVVFDLDDTLYKEIDYLISAFREIGEFLDRKFGKTNLYAEMYRYYNEDLDAFQKTIEQFQIPVKKEVLIKMYREHLPIISLDADTKMLLDALRQAGNCEMALITDGRFTTQTNKIKALGLNRYIDESGIIISEVTSHEKPDEFAYRRIEELYEDREYVYVGDNPEKDFLAPNRMGWDTVCLLDDGRNIHKQNFNLPKDYLPKRRIQNMKEIIDLV